MTKMIIADAYFVNKSGHFYEYNKSVKEIFEAHKVGVTVYGNRKLEPGLQSELNAIPYFDSLKKNAWSRIPVIGQLLNRVRFWRSYYQKIKKLYNSETGNDTVFFFTTVFWYDVLPIALVASASRHKSILLYRLSFKDHGGIPPVLHRLADSVYRYTFGKLLRRNNILYTTDSNVIAMEADELYHCPMITLPIPHLREAPAITAADKKQPTDTFRVYAPGAIRTEKGIAFITASFEHLNRTDPSLLQRLVLVTQYNDAGDTQLNDTIRQRLGKLNVANIFLGNLSSEAYEHEMAEADIILIPYSNDHGYRARTSGILAETIAACKPFLTTRDSWMGLQSEQYHTGLPVPYGDVEAFAEALRTLTENYAAHLQQAQDARAAWLAFHSRQNFYRIIAAGLQALA